MNTVQRFNLIGEPCAAGLYEEPGRSLFYRKALGLRRYYEALQPPEYAGKLLYPSGGVRSGFAVGPSYLFGFGVDTEALRAKDQELCDLLMNRSDFFSYQSSVPVEHTVAGNMYTHSMPHYERILMEGFNSYIPRIGKIQDADMREGLLHLLEGIRSYALRCADYLQSQGAPDRLVSAVRHTPFEPARDIFEAVQGWNFIYYLDGCDNPGSLASGLMPFWRGEDITDLLDCLFENVDITGGYSMSIGLEHNPLTVQCLRALRGKRRPMIELFVDETTPDDVWDEAIRSVLSGCGQPAFYNRADYPKTLMARIPSLTHEDAMKFCGGGCTEGMIAGLSNVGSLDAGINLLLIFEQVMQECLPGCKTFDEFYALLMERTHEVIRQVAHEIAASQERRAQTVPLPMRTLLVDDCIDKGLDYNNGGARYMWSVVNFAGIVNVVDSLLVIRDMVFGSGKISADEMLRLLSSGDEAFLRACRQHPHRSGINDPEANQLAYEYSHAVFSMLTAEKTFFGDGFLPSSIQFNSYAAAGASIGATPCGRHAGEALADSLSAIFGKDTEGPTSMLASVCALDLAGAPGIPVVNLTIRPDTSPDILRSLILGYMKLGGVQLQITCISRELLEAAYKSPEDHKNIIVRVGGYSEYYYRLGEDLRRKILERTLY